MTEAEKAYEAARVKIAEVKREGSNLLDLSSDHFHALETIPPEIAELSEVSNISFYDTLIADLSPLTGMAGITRLDLSRSMVTELTSLTGMTRITGLSLQSTQVSDFTPLATLTDITELVLNNTQIADLTPLAGMMGISNLFLNDTKVEDLNPLIELTGITRLSLGNTNIKDLTPLARFSELVALFLEGAAVVDLRPVLLLPGLGSDELGPAIRFRDCGATRVDAELKAISEIEDWKERLARLREALVDWVPPIGSNNADNDVIPKRLPAPIEIEISETQIAIARRDGPLDPDADKHAAMAWEALREYRQDFATDFSVSNYAPLPARLDAFDRVMGDAYDSGRVVRIGTQVLRFVALAQDEAFLATLPDGAAQDLRNFSAEMLVYLNRFPDWVAYREGAGDVTPEMLRGTSDNFEEISATLNAEPAVTDDLKEEYAAEVDEANRPDATAVQSTAIEASTHEIARELAEYESKQQRSNRDMAKRGGEAFDSFLAPLGMPHHLALKLEKPLPALAKGLGAKWDWVGKWYDLKFGPEDERKD